MVVDIDEAVVPKSEGAKQWRDILKHSSIKENFEKVDSLCFHEQQMVKTNDALETLKGTNSTNLTYEEKDLIALHESGRHYFLTHVHAVNTTVGADFLRKKCIHRLDRVAVVSSHEPVKCVGNNALAMRACDYVMSPAEVGRSFHYRAICEADAKEEVGIRAFPCGEGRLEEFEFEKDMAVWKYKEELTRAMEEW
jgi:hypothetical protein